MVSCVGNDTKYCISVLVSSNLELIKYLKLICYCSILHHRTWYPISWMASYSGTYLSKRGWNIAGRMDSKTNQHTQKYNLNFSFSLRESMYLHKVCICTKYVRKCCKSFLPHASWRNRDKIQNIKSFLYTTAAVLHSSEK